MHVLPLAIPKHVLAIRISQSTFSLESIKVCQQNSKTSFEFPGPKQNKSFWIRSCVL